MGCLEKGVWNIKIHPDYLTYNYCIVFKVHLISVPLITVWNYQIGTVLLEVFDFCFHSTVHSHGCSNGITHMNKLRFQLANIEIYYCIKVRTVDVTTSPLTTKFLI